MLRSVEDPSGCVFNLPSGCGWDIVVEVPFRSGHLNEPHDALSQEEGLWQELPVLACLGSMVSPPGQLDIDTDTKLVCKYLRAYQDNTIDEFYQTDVRGPKVCTAH